MIYSDYTHCRHNVVNQTFYLVHSIIASDYYSNIIYHYYHHIVTDCNEIQRITEI